MQPQVKGVTSYLVAQNAAAAIEFYKQVFGAVESFRMTDPGDGRIGHAELTLGDTRIMIADEYPDFGALSPDSIGGTPITLHVDTDQVDALVARAKAAGAVILRDPADQSYGERNAQLMDPHGYRWTLSQKIEDVDPAEMQKRWEEETQA